MPEPRLTPAQVQRRGRTRRFLSARPWIGRTAGVGALVVLGVATGAVSRSTVRGIISLGMYPADTPALWVVPLTWLVGAGLTVALLVALRERSLVLTGALTALGVVSLAVGGVLGVIGVGLACALYLVASHRNAMVTWAAFAGVVGVVTFGLWNWQVIGIAEILLWDAVVLPEGIEPGHALDAPEFSSGRRSASAALLLVLLLVGVATGSGARARRLHAVNIVERYEAMARDRDASADLARASERTRIAREMHDIVAHSVSVMIALSDGATAALDRAPDRSREALQELSRTGRSALADMQRVLGALDPDGPEPMEPTETELSTIIDRFRAAGLPVTASGLDALLAADTSVRLALVRIVSEALTNVLRHAPGTRSVTVTVRRVDGRIHAEVVDTGASMPGPGGGTGRGIVGMRERAALLGGHVDAGPAPHGGWRVRVTLPTGPAEEEER